MPFQFRRGTEAQRASTGITPASGELIHCTDSGAWYGGDGVTIGGRAMPGAIGQQAVTAPTADGVLLLDSAEAQWISRPLALSAIQGFNTTGAQDADVLRWDAGESSYRSSTQLPAGSRPLIVAPDVDAGPPASLRLYLSGDGAIGTITTLANEGSESITITPSPTSGTIERTAPSGAFGQAIDTSDMVQGVITCSGGASLGTGAFTIKMRLFVPASSPNNTEGGYLFTFAGDQGPYFYGSGQLWWWDGSGYIGDAITIPLDEWFELAFCRSSGTLYCLLNGTVEYSVAYPAAVPFPLYIANDAAANIYTPARCVFDEIQLWSTALHTSGYTPATEALSFMVPADLPSSSTPGTLWTRGPVSDGLFLCTAAGPLAAWTRIAYASELPPP